MREERFLAAAVQAVPVLLERDATVRKANALIDEAADHGVTLFAFPETWIPGYPAWIFGAAGSDDAASKRAYAGLPREPSAAVTVLG